MNDNRKPFAWEQFSREIVKCLDGEFMSQLMRKREETGSAASTMGKQDAAALYALVKIFKPAIVVETGTYRGMSSAFILKGMQDAGVEGGRLYSIDKQKDDKIGMLIPKGLSAGIVQICGEVSKVLESGELPAVIDMFVHDSAHLYSHQLWEFEAFWPMIRPGGCLVSHDVNWNSGFVDFLSKTYVHDQNGMSDLQQTTHNSWGRYWHIGFIEKRSELSS
jgi:predicted O-methyltransferase YrrM